MVEGWKPPRLNRPNCSERSVFSRPYHNSALLRCVIAKMLGKYKCVFLKAFGNEAFPRLVFEQRSHLMVIWGEHVD